MKYEARVLLEGIKDLYFSIGLLIAAGLMLAFTLGYLLGVRNL